MAVRAAVRSRPVTATVEHYEVLEGLKAGEQVVTIGQSSLKDDAKVEVVNAGWRRRRRLPRSPAAKALVTGRAHGLIEVCTCRPVAITMLTLAVLLFGMVSMSRLQVTLLPDLSYPTLTIRTELPGAAPTEVETLLSKPVEEAPGVIKGVRRVASVSRAGQGDVTLEFNWGTEMDFAVLDVREKLDALELPQEVERPVVLRFDPSQDPIIRMGFGVQACRRPAGAEDRRGRAWGACGGSPRIVQKPLEGVDGVVAVKISGGLEDEVQVLVDLQQLAQLNSTLQSGRAAARQAENANISGGRVDQGSAAYLVRDAQPVPLARGDGATPSSRRAPGAASTCATSPKCAAATRSARR